MWDSAIETVNDLFACHVISLQTSVQHDVEQLIQQLMWKYQDSTTNDYLQECLKKKLWNASIW